MLRRALRSSFRFCFVEAPYAAHPGPDVVRFFSHMAPFKAWLCPQHSETDRRRVEMTSILCSAIENAMLRDDESGADGEWVGVLGFSQGAKMAASLLYTQQYQMEVLSRENPWPHFKFGILLAGRAPMIWMDPGAGVPAGLADATTSPATAQLPKLPSIPLGRRLRTPTLHVHGLADPGLEYHRELLHGNCDQKYTRLFEWEGGHSVPSKPADTRALAEQIIAVASGTGALV